ncbi:tetratricopeptide repeat-containing sulfotransferase family protein [Pseudoxanthomonas daejeonensis]|uniref:Sulfotransferase n=1 Tax=Pseudoxanthomonas daejeonensis TaxID=266062 RepID=A0ABQ6ZA96_9GAMM|nr:tetratricopeptide repeat-containing sulfotransferase family protein [Pseudoxanthomonas daejeonensis]KAF1696794.1 hypothetical protein CSC65_01775 [Pseudoxanthomonas daejeonensis]
MHPSSPISGTLRQAALLERDGKVDAALRLLKQPGIVDPGDADAHRQVAQVAMRLGDAEMAIVHMRHATDLMPGDPATRFQFACLLAHEGRHADAVTHFQHSLERAPGNAQGWHLLGIALQRLARHGDALQALRRAYGLAPDNVRTLEALAESEFHAGYPEDALPLWRQLLTARPDDAHVVLRTSETLNRLGRHGEAQAMLREATTRHPQTGDLWMALAQTEEDVGDRDAARSAYRAALVEHPGWAPPVSGLLGLDRGKADDTLVAQAQELMAQADLPDADRALIGYELGKVLDGRGLHADAIGCWHQANAARRRMTGPGDVAAFERNAAHTMATLTRARLDARHARWSGNPDPRPLFIVGMPRSGTTLTEQILAAHPAGHGGGELPDIALIARNLRSGPATRDAWPDSIDALPDNLLEAAAQRYLRAATREASPDALRLVDKAPLNFFHLGLIALLFPRARVIWCRRDPRDIAVSVYGENFSLDEKLATDLEDIGHYINTQVRLMRHWQASLSIPILELDYEQLATRPEEQARRLIEFAGLPWDPACLEFHRSERGVQTPSRWQVKQPVYTRSIGRWRNYEQALGPLLAALAEDAYTSPVAGLPDGVETSDQANTPSD